MSLAAGTRLGPYEIVGLVGAGAMGEVYQATDTRLARRVAIKILAAETSADPIRRVRFEREARSIAALTHPHICTVHDVGDSNGTPYLVMEFLSGETLAQRLRRGSLPIKAVFDLGTQIAEALDAAHTHGIIHRDLKPGNVMLTEAGVKLLDFGIAKLAPKRQAIAEAVTVLAGRAAADLLTRASGPVGTVAYMSPEQARGDALDARTDVFSLGAVLYEMATGRRAFPGTDAAIFDAILNRTPPAPHLVNSRVPIELERIIIVAMERDPRLRFQTAADVAAELRRLRPVACADRGLPNLPVHDARRRRPGWVHAVLQRWPLGALAAALAIVLALAGLSQHRQVQALGEGDLVLVTEFANSTGDPVFEGTLRQALAVKIDESPFFSVLSEQRVQQTLRYMQREANTPLTREVGRDICLRQGVKALVTGAIARLGETYVITLTAENCSTGDALAREQVQALEKQAVLDALGKAAAGLRRRLGESLDSVQKLDAPIEQATTSSLDALRAFSLGNRERASGSEANAVPLYRRAVELDPDFAMAHARLGTVYGNLGELEQAREHRIRAFELRDRVSERERFYISAHYYNAVENDPARAAEIYESWKRTYPRDAIPHINLGLIYTERGDDELALASFLQGIRVDPMQRLGYEDATAIYIKQGKLREALALIDRELEVMGENPQPYMHLFTIDALTGNTRVMAGHEAKLRGTMYECMALEIRAKMAAQRGRFAEYRRLLGESVTLGEQQGMSEWARTSAASRAVTEAMAGYTSTARVLAETVLSSHTASQPQLMNAALGLALSGDVPGALVAIRESSTRARTVTEDTALETMVKATVEWRSGRPARALALLDTLDLLSPKKGEVFGAMLIRGDALLASARARDAEAQYLAILDRRTLAPFDIAVPLAHLGLAHARALTGNTAGARAAYDAFFAMWKDADGDVPLLVHARDRYAALDGGS